MPGTPGRKPSQQCGVSESSCCCGHFPFCRCPIQIPAEMAEIYRRPAKPLKIPMYIPVTRVEEE